MKHFGNFRMITNFETKSIKSVSLSVIQQKGESQNECFKKTKHTKFSEKKKKISNLDTPTYIRVHIRGSEMFFFFREIWCALFSWNTHFEIHPFTLLPMNWCMLLIWSGDINSNNFNQKHFYNLRQKSFFKIIFAHLKNS